MKFFVPVQPEHLRTDLASGRQVVPLYINPQNISIREQKIIRDVQTKGGFIVQYWGERLPVMTISGETGSGGIEAVNILRDVYRNEQFQIKNQLLRKLQESNNAIVEQFNDPANIENIASFGEGVANVLSDGAFGNLLEGTKSVINGIVDSFDQLVDENTKTVVLAPSLAAYAVSVDLFFQGEKFRGYFTQFSVTERAQQPGLFSYDFGFTVTKRLGKRKNFMPWHRNPRDQVGNPRTATIPKFKEIDGEDSGLSFPPTYSQGGAIFQSGSNVSESAENQSTPTSEDFGEVVPINRLTSSND